MSIGVSARAIPCLLLRGEGLVKTVRFRNPKYIGDPINAVRLFNDLEVDELILLDITASTERREPPFDRIAEIAGEAFMPICYGGGVTSLDAARRLFKSGVEKVAVTTALVENPALVREIADTFGEQAVVAGIDVKRDLFGRQRARILGGRKGTGLDPVALAVRAAELGAGEILLSSIDREGTYQGYDLDLVRAAAAAVPVPVIALGGAGEPEHLRSAVDAGAQAAAAGSLFVYKGPHRAVLVNYPKRARLQALFAANTPA
ncbi:AglZ/HisF2 family acetamidino modification protein [Sphingomonas canadensis]|uniref:Imidazole glycerol phosphate synthase subunit HisF n=1 Tax=Sphingomonas canadensis TaxID=1219257 RepID=A0ABW3H3T0_9SPHN|nr:AglZ/HisF2 family acetamidino modification protein [Sphingomonas canadensis]MCW3835409.1 AglZ/HisF2 family acetamidino modification protein [Sphingomonas canadensis]